MKDSQALFRIKEIVIDANRLAEVLLLLAGKVRGMSAPEPMVNAKRGRNGGVTPMSSGELIEMFQAWLAERKLREINTKVAREFLESHGRAAGSTSYLFNKMRDAGLIKNIGTSPADSRWQLLGGARAAASKRKPVRKTAKPKKIRSKPKPAASEASS